MSKSATATMKFARAWLAFIACVFSASALTDANELPQPSQTYRQGILAVREYGAGENTVILLPGLVSGPWVWAQTIASLAPHYRIVAITLPGFDGQAPTQKRPLLQTTLGDLLALIDDKKLQRPVLIGHSVGGTLAIAFATEHSERIAGVVALEGLPVFPATAQVPAENRDQMAAQSAQAFLKSCADALACQTQYMERVGTTDSQRARTIAAKAAKSDMTAASEWVQEIMRADFRPQLASIRVPVLEVVPFNAADAMPPIGSAADKERFYSTLLAKTPNARTVVINDARHFAMLDQPEAWHRELTKFLASVTPP